MTVPGLPPAAGRGLILDDERAAVVIMTGLPVSAAPTGLQMLWLLGLALAEAAHYRRPPRQDGGGGQQHPTEPAR